MLRKTGSVVVALSGGVDSAVLLSLALEAVGRERVVAVTASSPSLAAEDLEDARRTARALGAAHRVVESREMEVPEYRANDGTRCYHCRSELFSVLGAIARESGVSAVAYGAIVDDSADDRPGMRAASERGILAPLAAAGIGKDDVRRLAEAAGLEVRDKPAAACLASRIPVGTQVTESALRSVEHAESALRRLGFATVRVRHHGEVARIELSPEEIDRMADPSLRAAAARGVRQAGFRFVCVDLEGYRSGSVAGPRFHSIGPIRSRGQ